MGLLKSNIVELQGKLDRIDDTSYNLDSYIILIILKNNDVFRIFSKMKFLRIFCVYKDVNKYYIKLYLYSIKHSII